MTASPFSVASLIAPDRELDGAPVLGTRVSLASEGRRLASAVLRYSALGIVEARIDGEPVSPDVLTPGWSSYEWRIRVAETDVTPLVGHRTDVALELELGNGWYRGNLTWMDASAVYGDEIAGIAELEVRYDDGHVRLIGTDATWTAHASATVSDDLYRGQTIDARRRGMPGEEIPVHVVADDLARFEPYVGPPVRRQGEVAPKATWTSPSGALIVDFGQNLVGWVRCEVSGPRGSEIVLHHAEVLEDDELALRPLRSATATDRFVLSGEVDVFEPTFTFHGFRYVQIDGWPGGAEAFDPAAVTAVVVASDLQRTGTFRSSNESLNALHRNVVWSTRGNFLDIPSDCPQRDERLGWTGDIAVFAPTAAFLFDVEDFLRDWLRDLRLEQEHQDGLVPYVVPDVLKHAGMPEEFTPMDSTAIWSDAAVWVPWAVWEASGDRRVLTESFDSMRAHVRRVEALLSPSGLWDRGFQFGDWLDPDAPPESPEKAKADPGLVATASFYRSVVLTASSASLLGREEEQTSLDALAARIRQAYREAYIDAQGERLHNHCTTAYALSIVFGLLDAPEERWAGRRLAELVADSGYRISTGFAGTPFILDALSTTGQLDAASRLLLQEDCPSWLYPVRMGATTIWERWDSMLPDGTVNPGEMTSFNHYALGAVADWMHRVLGGLAPAAPGYERILVAPRPIDGVDWAETAIETARGHAAVSWNREADGFRVEVVVPPGAEAQVSVLDVDAIVGAGTHVFHAVDSADPWALTGRDEEVVGTTTS